MKMVFLLGYKNDSGKITIFRGRKSHHLFCVTYVSLTVTSIFSNINYAYLFHIELFPMQTTS